MAHEREGSRRPKVVKLIWWIPHYRAAVFRRLSQNPHLDFVVWAGNNTARLGVGTVVSASDVGKGDGIHWRHLESRYIRQPIFKGLEWQPQAVKLARKENIDVMIILGAASVSNWIVRLICWSRGIPVIEWSHGTKRPEHGLRWTVKKFYLKWAKAQLLYGNFARDFFAANGFKDEELFVVYNSLDHEEQVAIRERLTPEDLRRTREEFGLTGPDDRLIVHSVRIEKWKKLDLLCDAMRLLKERGRRIVLVLIGDGPMKQGLRDRADRNGVGDRVVLYGACYDENTIGRIISAADLCVVPSRAGLIVIHSFVYGTPLLTCENTSWLHGPEIEAVIEGKTGAFFREDDVEDLARKIDEMLYPEPCKPQMSEACRRIVDTYYTPAYQERVIIDAINYVVPPEKRVPRPTG